jgi:hypothetical protein
MKHHIEIKNGPKAGSRSTRRRTSSTPRAPPQDPAEDRQRFGAQARRPPRPLPPKDGEVGVSYQLEGVQILKLVSGGQRSASDYGFGVEDGDTIQDDNGGFADERLRASRRRKHRPRLLMQHSFFLEVPPGGLQDSLRLPRALPDGLQRPGLQGVAQPTPSTSSRRSTVGPSRRAQQGDVWVALEVIVKAAQDDQAPAPEQG